MATKIRITDDQRSEFFRAREAWTADTAKSIRRETWDRIRAQHGIPDDIKLKVEIDDGGSPDYLVVKDKRTGNPLWKLGDGRVVASQTEPAEAASLPDAAPEISGRFASVEPTFQSLYGIHVHDLLAALRGGDAPGEFVFRPRTLPTGLPPVSPEGVVLDTVDRVLYFRD